MKLRDFVDWFAHLIRMVRDTTAKQFFTAKYQRKFWRYHIRMFKVHVSKTYR